MTESPALSGPGDLASAGFILLDPQLPAADLDRLRDVAFGFTGAGQRCLLDIPEVTSMALRLLASTRTFAPSHRRVLHFVFFDGPAIPEAWHRSVA